MAAQKKRIQKVLIVVFFILYFISAARPVPREIILSPSWISSLESGIPVSLSPAFLSDVSSSAFSEQLVPFALGDRFGYVDSTGNFAINRVKTGDINFSENLWTEYPAEPTNIEIKNTLEETVINIEGVSGYPVLLDNRVFILGSEMNSLSEIDSGGNVRWSYDFGAPLTCFDAAAGLVITGSLDGVVEILDSNGNRIFYFEPGGSRLSVILGCAVSKNGSRVGIISGIDQQRFLLLERVGGIGSEFRIVYHEFLDDGFRRPVRISFIDEDRRVVFEREGGIGSYNIRSRRGIFIPLDGQITAMEYSGDQGLLFLITSDNQRELVGIRLPQDRRFAFLEPTDKKDAVFLRAPFKSSDVFLDRTGNHGQRLIVGGGTILISFELESI